MFLLIFSWLMIKVSETVNYDHTCNPTISNQNITYKRCEYTDEPQVVITNSNFFFSPHKTCETYAEYGGHIHVVNGKLTIEGNSQRMESGYASKEGGSIYVRKSTEISINGVTFRDNTAKELGGCLVLLEVNVTNLRRVNAYNCRSQGRGNFLLLEGGDANFTHIGGEIFNCYSQAPYDFKGGAISFYTKKPFYVENVTLYHCQRHAGLSFASFYMTTTTNEECMFRKVTSNSNYGTSLNPSFEISLPNTNFSMKNSLFHSNSGGGITINYCTALECENNLYEYNTNPYLGSGMLVYEVPGNITITSDDHYNNRNGGLVIHKCSNLIVFGSTFRWNSGLTSMRVWNITTVAVKSTSYYSNYNNISFTACSITFVKNVVVSGCSFNNNSCNGLRITDVPKTLLSDSSFRRNRCSEDGYGFYYHPESETYMQLDVIGCRVYEHNSTNGNKNHYEFLIYADYMFSFKRNTFQDSKNFNHPINLLHIIQTNTDRTLTTEISSLKIINCSGAVDQKLVLIDGDVSTYLFKDIYMFNSTGEMIFKPHSDNSNRHTVKNLRIDDSIGGKSNVLFNYNFFNSLYDIENVIANNNTGLIKVITEYKGNNENIDLSFTDFFNCTATTNSVFLVDTGTASLSYSHGYFEGCCKTVKFTNSYSGSTHNTMYNITYYNNSGDACYVVQKSDLDVTNCVFTNNSMHGLYVEARDFDIKTITFYNNSMVGNGGGLYLKLTGAANLYNCSFISNAAEDGSAVYSEKSTDVRIEDCMMKNCIHNNEGSYHAISFHDAGSLAFINNNIDECGNTSGTGVLYFVGSGAKKSEIIDNVFSDCKTGESTNMVHIKLSNDVLVENNEFNEIESDPSSLFSLNILYLEGKNVDIKDLIFTEIYGNNETSITASKIVGEETVKMYNASFSKFHEEMKQHLEIISPVSELFSCIFDDGNSTAENIRALTVRTAHDTVDGNKASLVDCYFNKNTGCTFLVHNVYISNSTFTKLYGQMDAIKFNGSNISLYRNVFDECKNNILTTKSPQIVSINFCEFMFDLLTINIESSSLTMSDCYFLGCYGKTVMNTEKNEILDFNNVTFIRCGASSLKTKGILIISDCLFEDLIYDDSVSAINVSAAYCTVMTTKFKKNLLGTVDYLISISTESKGEMIMNTCEISDNTIKDKLINIDENQMTSFILKNSTFSRNTKPVAPGLPMFKITVVTDSRKPTISIIDNKIEENSLGLLSMVVSDSITVEGNRFIKNTAIEKGACLMITDMSIKAYIVKNNTFSNNECDGEGAGAMYISTSQDKTILLIGNMFDGNIASENGGAVKFVSNLSTLILSWNTFHNNTAVNGGGLYAEGKLIFKETNLFSYNEAAIGSGGAAYLDTIQIDSTDSISVKLISNIAKSSGGGFYISETSENTLVHITADNCSAHEFGGGLFSQSQISLIECILSENVANKAGSGCYFLSSAALILNKCEILGNTYNDEGTDLVGAGIFVENSANVVFDECKFIGNTCKKEGGAIYGKNLLSITFSKMNTMKYNEADKGGALYLVNPASFDINCSLISDNNAAVSGSFLYFDQAAEDKVIQIANLNHGSSPVSGSGGVIHGVGGKLVVIQSELGNSSSDASGGAIFFNGKEVVLNFATIFNCSSVVKGGGCYLTCTSKVVIANSTFATNVGSIGGGLSIEAPETSIVNSTMRCNNAAQRGANLDIKTTKSCLIDQCHFSFIQLAESSQIFVTDVALNSLDLPSTIINRSYFCSESAKAYYTKPQIRSECSGNLVITNNYVSTGKRGSFTYIKANYEIKGNKHNFDG